ncbi:Integrase catalytic region [Pseudodesulfovibrio aespoeensis Aspo-2]|uniref:Integrase catalytic region n=1 Tax=Pseudodesulfovibrio aespoeensis (strain ATCC 700646 / DSM 10631 / Aspo-2) TaxID=643562 RepID=E6VW33_PSEA9|nr:Integrase catalytic region [Pseudodesulfovibrio aespoeensis Aspo-2]
MVNAFELSSRKACAAMGISRSYYAYKPHPRDDSDVIAALTELAEKKPTWGFSKLFNVLRQQGKPWNHKKVWRVYCLLKMNLKRKAKKRLPQASRTAVAQPLAPNHCWSIDFMRDTLYSGRVFRTFNAVDDYNREALAVEIDTNMPAGRVVRVLDRVAEERGCYPERLRMDNGPEFSGTVMAAWAESHGVNLEFIQPGKPTQNSYIERFNRTYREEVLDLYVFNSLSEVRAITEDFIREYNEGRPHESLGNMSPINFAAQRAGGTPCPLGNPPENCRESLPLTGPMKGDFTRPPLTSGRHTPKTVRRGWRNCLPPAPSLFINPFHVGARPWRAAPRGEVAKSGRNALDSKSSYGLTARTWVRIPPSPPLFFVMPPAARGRGGKNLLKKVLSLPFLWTPSPPFSKTFGAVPDN